MKVSKQNNPELMWKRECPSLSGCHLAVSWSWASYHTSSERGYSGLSADIKTRTIDQLIGILWSYFEHFWGLANILNILVCYSVTPCARLCTIHQLKGHMLSIHMRYSSLLSTERLQRYYSILIHIQAGLVCSTSRWSWKYWKQGIVTNGPWNWADEIRIFLYKSILHTPVFI